MMVNGSGLADDAAKQEGVGLAQPVPPQAAVVIAAPPSHTAAGQTVTVVQAMPVAPPTTRKGPGSREAIVIGFANNPEVFQVAMKDAPCEEPCYFCFGCMFPCCAAFHLRQKILGENFESEYSCCQVDNLPYTPCCGPGGPCCDLLSCWKSCPTIALCTEAWCCTGLSLSFTRIHAMHKFNVRPDPMDYTCIQFSNCMQVLSCLCHVAAIFQKELKELAQCVDCCAECAFHMTAGCMLAQTNAEVNFRAMPNAGMAAPLMAAAPVAAVVASAPPASQGKGGLQDGLMANAAAQDMSR